MKIRSQQDLVRHGWNNKLISEELRISVHGARNGRRVEIHYRRRRKYAAIKHGK